MKTNRLLVSILVTELEELFRSGARVPCSCVGHEDHQPVSYL